MGLTGEKVQGSLSDVWLSKESGSWSGLDRILCPVSSSMSEMPISRKWEKSFAAQDLVCALLP